MQKMISVCINTKQLTNNPNNPFSVTEVEEVNQLLDEGWEVEDWDMVKDDSNDGIIILLVVLTDDAMYEDEEEFFGMEENDEEEEVVND